MLKDGKCYCEFCGKEITGRTKKKIAKAKHHFCNNECKFASKLNKVVIDGEIVRIIIKNSKNTYECIVDKKDYIEKIKPLNCTLFALEESKYKKPYVYFQEKQTRKKIKLHRYLTNCPINLVVDHKNGDVLDNRQENLRICDSVTNLQNTNAQKNSKSGVKGVCWRESRKLWIGLVQIDGIRTKVIETKDYNKCCAYTKMFRDFALACRNHRQT